MIRALIGIVLATALILMGAAAVSMRDQRALSARAARPEQVKLSVSAPRLRSYVESIPGALARLEMVAIPPGKIAMPDGSDVEIKPFWISSTEVPWDIFDHYAFFSDKKGRSLPSDPYGNPDHGFGHEGYPAISMTFHCAEQFCVWLSEKTGRKYRLPTEAEWEFVARAGWPYEGAVGELDSVAWFRDNADDKSQPVARKRPNRWGLYDTLGNAAEWCVGLDGKPVACGGSWKTRGVARGGRPALDYRYREYQDAGWNRSDPNEPKGRYWLTDGNFIGLRVVREE